jgi:hypothetical protein
MLRHKAMVQCARICFGLGGVYEPDEAARIASSALQRPPTSTPKNAQSLPQVINRTAKARGLGTASGHCGSDTLKSWLKDNSQ